MKYFEVDFKIESVHRAMIQDACDIMSALAGEAGFETFEETDDGIRGYVQQSLFDDSLLQSLIQSFPMEGITIHYQVKKADDRDWNEQWEQEGFDPIIINHQCIVHDGRHFGPLTTDGNTATSLLSSYETAVEIDAHLAFGTGTHETTQMMIASLLELPVTDANVLDCGCGTGILGLVALKRGAKSCIGYDIDEWSVDNARHNAVINQVDERYQSLLGDATILQKVEGTFQVVMANINRNILLNDMEAFCGKLSKNGTLLLSGFYEEDVPLLTEKATSLGLKIISQRKENNWTCLTLTKR